MYTQSSHKYCQVVLCSERSCDTAWGNSVKSRDTTPSTLSKCYLVANNSDTNDEVDRVSHMCTS